MKEVGHILNGVLLLALLWAAIGVGQVLMSIKRPAPDQVVQTTMPLKNALTATAEKGKAIFREQCSTCHSIEHSCPPLLENVEQRVPSRQLLYAFIRNSDSVLKAGNPYYTEMVRSFGGVRMPPFPHLTDEDIEAVMAYVRETSN